MWSFIRAILLFLVASSVVAEGFTAKMVGPDGKVVHLDPERDFTPFNPHHPRLHHNHRVQRNQLDTNNGDPVFSRNWCGVVVNSNTSGYISELSGRFIVPELTIRENKHVPQYPAAWIGLDGYSCRSGFPQAGVLSLTNRMFWWWWPSHGALAQSLDVKAGDEIYISLDPSVKSEPGKWTAAEIILENVNASSNVIIQDPGPDDPNIGKLCGEDAEWILEDTTITWNDEDSPQADLADFARIKAFLARGVITYPSLQSSEDIYLTNMSTRIFLMDDDGVRCRSAYSNDPVDLDQAMWLGERV